MIAEMGAFALVLSLVLSVAQVGLSALGGGLQVRAFAGAGQGAAVGAFIALAAAFAALLHAFITSDFSVANAAANSHTDKPLIYKIAGAWGSHEGSMLLWCLNLTGFGAAVAVQVMSASRPTALSTAASGSRLRPWGASTRSQ